MLVFQHKSRSTFSRERLMFSVVWEWLTRGWQDFRQAAFLNMAYAGFFLVIGLVAVLGLHDGGFNLVYFILAGGFLIVVPSLVTVYYYFAGSITCWATAGIFRYQGRI